MVLSLLGLDSYINNKIWDYVVHIGDIVAKKRHEKYYKPVLEEIPKKWKTMLHNHHKIINIEKIRYIHYIDAIKQGIISEKISFPMSSMCYIIFYPYRNNNNNYSSKNNKYIWDICLKAKYLPNIYPKIKKFKKWSHIYNER